MKKNYKMRYFKVENTITQLAVQMKLFELGYKWITGESDLYIVAVMKYIDVDCDGFLAYSSICGNSTHKFCRLTTLLNEEDYLVAERKLNIMKL